MPRATSSIHNCALNASVIKRTATIRGPQKTRSVCAKLLTTNSATGQREVVVLSLNKPVTIGRNPILCSYVISDIVVSSLHCKLWAISSSTGGVIVSCQDLSTNGIVLNGHKVRKTSVIIMDGDTLEIPCSQKFTCIHVLKELREKTTIFEPTPPPEPVHKSVGKYTVTSHCLGSGSFAVVHLSFDTKAHRQVACKTIKARKESDLCKVMKEVKILLGLAHPNINRVWDVETDGKWLHIFLQLCTGGDLFTYISSHLDTDQRLCEGEAKYIMYQILIGLKYLHDRNISHRDIKPENILLYSPGPYPRIQIADFGLARPQAYQETLNVCGTVSYLPPEGILALSNKNLGYLGMPADCWSAGVLLYTMLSGMHPFDYPSASSEWITEEPSRATLSQASQFSIVTENVIKRRIVSGEFDFHDYVWDGMADAKDLVGRLLIYNQLHRLNVNGALLSRWVEIDRKQLEEAYQERVSSA